MARIGGDEFVLVVQNCDKEKVLKIIDSISYELDERLIFSDKKYDFTVSCGYVYVEPQDHNIKDLISKADKRMYQEKSRKREEVNAVN